MTVTKKHTVKLTGATAVVAELTQRGSNFVYTEHTFPGGSFDAALRNSAGQSVSEPDLFSMAQKAVNAAPETVA